MKSLQYSFAARFADGVGTNPEELIAASHAGCFSMALSAELGKAGFTPDSIETTAVVTLDLHGEKPTVTKSHLTTKAKIPGIDKAKFDEILWLAQRRAVRSTIGLAAAVHYFGTCFVCLISPFALRGGGAGNRFVCNDVQIQLAVNI